MTVTLEPVQLILLVLTCNPERLPVRLYSPVSHRRVSLIAKVFLCFRVQAFCFTLDVDCGVEVAVNHRMAVPTLIYTVV